MTRYQTLKTLIAAAVLALGLTGTAAAQSTTTVNSKQDHRYVEPGQKFPTAPAPVGIGAAVNTRFGNSAGQATVAPTYTARGGYTVMTPKPPIGNGPTGISQTPPVGEKNLHDKNKQPVPVTPTKPIPSKPVATKPVPTRPAPRPVATKPVPTRPAPRPVATRPAPRPVTPVGSRPTSNAPGFRIVRTNTVSPTRVLGPNTTTVRDNKGSPSTVIIRDNRTTPSVPIRDNRTTPVCPPATSSSRSSGTSFSASARIDASFRLKL